MSSNLDFDYLSKLYRTNPEEFEQIRKQEIEKLIEEAPESNKQRLRGLQFQIDAQRNIHKDSPMGACIAISKMMHESFEELRFQLNLAVNYSDPLGHQLYHYKTPRCSGTNQAKIIPLRK